MTWIIEYVIKANNRTIRRKFTLSNEANVIKVLQDLMNRISKVKELHVIKTTRGD